MGIAPERQMHAPFPRHMHCCFQDDVNFEIGEGVEELLRLLEEGRTLPADPRQVGRPKESAQAFLARMGRLRARYNAQFLKRKDWQASADPVNLLLATPTGLAARAHPRCRRSSASEMSNQYTSCAAVLAEEVLLP